ncbi:ABC transporter ATP-binding protein [Ilumatobacter sp.]|uniref:ABC transporter ATP-binding protein n=1 Tax=Ilumatobacter sp. TaxID=1967498 RepID=UPI003B51AB17
MPTDTTTEGSPRSTASGSTPLIDARDLGVRFQVGGPPWNRTYLHAVKEASFTIARGETLGLVGESGSGKSTTGRALLRLVDLHTGTVEVDGEDVGRASGSKLRALRKRMQMVFQDPYSSLDPSMVVGESIAEPLQTHTSMSRSERVDVVKDLLEKVGLSAAHAERYPYEFSGGQRQRVAIARAISLQPDMIVMDEAVSALDVSTQNQVINLVESLRDEFELAYLFIAHDLSVVRHISHRVAVMYLGEIVEIGPTERVYNHPAHPYTEALLAAVPVPDPKRQRNRERVILTGDLPDPTNPPSGCSFHNRCRYAMDVCSEERPPLVEIAGGGEVRCHLQTSGPTLDGRPLEEAESLPTA